MLMLMLLPHAVASLHVTLLRASLRVAAAVDFALQRCL